MTTIARGGAAETGDDLRILRLSRRLTQRQVAGGYGCSRSWIVKAEAKPAGHLRPTTVRRYLAAVIALAASR